MGKTALSGCRNCRAVAQRRVPQQNGSFFARYFLFRFGLLQDCCMVHRSLLYRERAACSKVVQSFVDQSVAERHPKQPL